MKLTVVAPSFTKEIEVAWLELNTPEGSYVIQSGHAPIMLKLSPDKKITYCVDTGKQESMLIPDGIVDITRTQATVIISELPTKQ